MTWRASAPGKDAQNMDATKTQHEEIEVEGDNLLAKVRELVHEGNVRRVIVKGEDGHTLLEIPLQAGLAAGVLTVAFLPVLAAIGAIAAVVSHVTLVVERREQ
jgi:hypothetical protein